VTSAALRRPAPPGEDLRRLWSLTWTMAVTEWRLRFYGSFFGYLWSLARPFALFGVIYVVFAEFAELGKDVPHYALSKGETVVQVHGVGPFAAYFVNPEDDVFKKSKR
jgi:hypothetical protein